MRFVLLTLVALATPAFAQEPNTQTLVESPRAASWPFTLDLHVLAGVEPHDRGNPVAFGVGGEVMWRGWVGAFVGVLASEGAPVAVATLDGKQQPSLADRVSIPIALVLRPFIAVATAGDSWARRLAGGVGLQLGLTIEYLRSSDDSATTAGLHLGLNIDIPIYGGPLQGNGVALRLYGRFMVTPEVTLEANKSIEEPVTSAQIFAGIVYYP